VLPGRAAETRADARRSSGAATWPSRWRCAAGSWAVQPSRSPSRCPSRCPASAPACRRRCRCPGGAWSPRPSRTWRGAGGRRHRGGPSRSCRSEPLVRLARLLLPHLHGLAAASRPPPRWLGCCAVPCSRGINEPRPDGGAPARLAAIASHQWTLIDATRTPASSRSAEGLAPSTSEPMTTPSTRSGRGPGCRQGSVATASSPRPGSTMRPCHCRVAWASSPVASRRRRPARHVAEASAPAPARAAAGPRPRRRRPRHRAGPGDAGPVEGLARARLDPAARPAIGLRLGPAASRSAITRTDLTDLTRLSLQPSTWRIPVGGCRRLGWAVRRPVLVPARAARSVAVAEMRVRRASWPACGRRGWAGWWGR
jgi:hypothetical protein